MAFNVGTITAELEINGQQFIATLQNADEVLQAFGASARDAAQESGGLFQSFIDFKGAFDLMVDGFNLVADALGGVVEFFGKAIAASDEFEANVQGLEVALRLRGLGQMKEDLVGLSIELEGATKFSRNTSLEVERLLTVFGVGRKDIPGFTEAVLNLSHAMGIDTVAAARLLGRSLSGSVGRLSQYIPEAKDLSDATLKMGGAFDLVNEKLGGFARAAANTSEAIEARFFNAVTAALQNFGDALSPILDVFFVAGRDILNALSEGLAANRGSIQSFFAGIAQTGVSALQAIVDFLIDLPVHITRVQVFFGNLKTSIIGAFAESKVVALDFLATLQAKFAEFAGSIGGRLFGFGEEDVAAAQAALQNTQVALAGARAESEALAASLAASEAEGVKLVAAAQASADAIRSGADSSSTWAVFIQQVQTSLSGANQSLQDMVDGVEHVDDSFDAINEGASRLSARLRELRERTGTLAPKEELNRLHEGLTKASSAAKETASAVRGISSETDSASDSADRLADSFSNVASSVRSAADSFSATAGTFGQFGGGGGGFLDSALALDPRSGGTRNLGLGSSAQTAAYLSSLGNTAGLSDIYGARTRADAYRSQVAGFLRGQIQEETKAFTQGIIDELSRLGIFDPTQRNAYIAQRFDEARRLGILPRGTSLGGSQTIGGIQ